MSRLFATLLFALLIPALSGCDSGGPSDPEVDEAIVIGTRVQPDFRSTGRFDLVALPLDEEGEAILTSGIEATIEIEAPTGLVASPVGRAIDEPTGDPLAVALSIDASGSTAGTDPTDARLAGARTLVRVLDAEEVPFEAAVFRYPPTGDLLQGFTSDLDSLDAAIARIGSGGGTPTYASLLRVLAYVEEEKPATGFDRSVVLLSDGQPGDRRLRPEVCARAVALDVPIYAIGLGPASDIDGNQADAVEEMRAVAECTGAAYAGISPADVDSSAARIFGNIGVAASEGSITFEVQVEGAGFEGLQAGAILRGRVELRAGGASASAAFSFRVP